MENENSHSFTLTLILTVFVILVYQIAGQVIEINKVAFLHESTVGILSGLGCAWIIGKIIPNLKIDFD